MAEGCAGSLPTLLSNLSEKCAERDLLLNLGDVIRHRSAVGPGAPYRAVVDRHAISVFSGRAYAALLPVSWPFRLASNMSDAPEASLVELYEDGRRLGPAHALHERIRRTGLGAYSHWNGALIFSTRDGSDPRANGRIYAVAARQQLVSAAPLAISLALTGAASVWLLLSSELWRRRATGSLTRSDRSPARLQTPLAWIPFRADSVAIAERLVAAMFSGPAGILTFGQALVLAGMVVARIWQLVAQAAPLREDFLVTRLYARARAYALSVIVIAIGNSDLPQAFVYFRVWRCAGWRNSRQ
jgi:hypothetical protein